jgi:thiamine transport system substrate-binding protein
MRQPLRILVTALTIAIVVASCDPAGEPPTLRLIAHDSFKEGVTDDTFAAFTEATGIGVEVIAAGDAGVMVNQSILSKDNPLADVLFGIDDTFLSRAIDAGIFLPHEAAPIGSVDPGLLRADNLVTPIDIGDVCINYDKAWFEEAGMTVPVSLDELRDPEVASLLVVEHPATSSPGLAFLLATIDRYGEDGWAGFWADLRRGGVEVSSSWSAAYYGSFTRYGGERPLVVSYASSPPAEVMFADPPTSIAPTGVITEGCYRQVEYAGVLAGTDHPEAAGELIEYMLSIEFQEQVPESWFVFPVNQEAELPPVFATHAVLPPEPTRFDPDHIAANRDRWIDEWIEVMEQP